MPSATEDQVYARGKVAMDALGLTLSPWLFDGAGGARGTREVAHRCYAIRLGETVEASGPRRPNRAATADTTVVVRVLSRIRAAAADTDYAAALALRQTIRAAVVHEASGTGGDQGVQHWRWVSSTEASASVADGTHLYTDHTFLVHHMMPAF